MNSYENLWRSLLEWLKDSMDTGFLDKRTKQIIERIYQRMTDMEYEQLTIDG